MASASPVAECPLPAPSGIAAEPRPQRRALIRARPSAWDVLPGTSACLTVAAYPILAPNSAFLFSFKYFLTSNMPYDLRIRYIECLVNVPTAPNQNRNLGIPLDGSCAWHPMSASKTLNASDPCSAEASGPPH